MAPEKRSENRIRLSASNFKYLAFLFLATFLVFWDVFLLQKAFLSGDHLIQHYPWAKFLQDHIRQFKLPWWTREIQCGLPLLAEGQIGAFYPLNILFLAILPLKWAYNYEALFHFILGACFTYAYVRSLNVSREASFLSSLIFLLGSAEGGFFYNITSQRVSIWFPLALWVIEKLIQRPSFRLASLLGIIHSLQVVAGYQQIALYTLLFAAFYFLLRISSFNEKEDKMNRFRALSYFALSILLCLAMTSIQWYPFLQLSSYSSRAEATEPLAYLGSLPPFFLMTLLFPDWTGFWGGGGGLYIGILGFFFVLVALLTDKKSQVEKSWCAILIVSVLLALGKFSPLYILIVKLFKIYCFRVPSKFLFFASTALAVLAGFGFEKFFTTNRDIKSIQRTTIALWGFFSLTLVTMFISHWVGIYYKGPILGFLKNYVANHIYGQPYHPHSLDIYYEKLVNRYELFLYLSSLRAPQTFVPIILFILQMSGLHFIFKKLGKQKLIPLLLVIAFLDLSFYAHLNTRRDLLSYDKTEIRSSLFDKIFPDRDIFRIHEFNTEPQIPDVFPLMRNQNMLFGIDDLGIYSPFAFARYKKLLGELGGVDDSLYEVKASIEGLKDKRRLLDQLNVKYVFSTVPLRSEGLKEIGKEGNVWLYQNESFWPRAFVVKTLDGFPDLGRIKKVEIVERGEDYSVFNTEGSGEGYLVVSESNYPGWKFIQGGKTTTPIPVGDSFKAIPLTEHAGKTTLRFTQEHVGILSWISFLGLFLAVAGTLSKT